ncbi:MAG: hypothetical protein ABI682_08385 [Acidobacteriota bacterium]
MRTWKKVAIGAGILVVAGVAAGVAVVGPRNVIGMIRYDKREEGRLKLGDAAPDVQLVGLDGVTPVRISEKIGSRPLVLVFGSYT